MIRDCLLLPFLAAAPALATVTQDDLSFWERILEKWGIGLIGFGLFYVFARWAANRDDKTQAARDARDAANQVERTDLLAKNNALQIELLKAMNLHAAKNEQLSRDSIKANSDNAAATRMLIRKMKRPCVNPIDDFGDETYPSE